jgi:hypothetical protein
MLFYLEAGREKLCGLNMAKVMEMEKSDLIMLNVLDGSDTVHPRRK